MSFRLSEKIKTRRAVKPKDKHRSMNTRSPTLEQNTTEKDEKNNETKIQSDANPQPTPQTPSPPPAPLVPALPISYPEIKVLQEAHFLSGTEGALNWVGLVVYHIAYGLDNTMPIDLDLWNRMLVVLLFFLPFSWLIHWAAFRALCRRKGKEGFFAWMIIEIFCCGIIHARIFHEETTAFSFQRGVLPYLVLSGYIARFSVQYNPLR